MVQPFLGKACPAMSTPRPVSWVPSEATLFQDVPPGLPADLARALNWLRAHLSEPIHLEHLAQVAGVRPRTLQARFKMFLGTTPLGFLRRMRLARARQDLLQA